jgi:hypothetical protein
MNFRSLSLSIPISIDTVHVIFEIKEVAQSGIPWPFLLLNTPTLK